MKRGICLLVYLGVACVCGTCARNPGASTGGTTTTAYFALKLSDAAVWTIARVEVVVAGPDMSEIRQDLRKEGDIYTGILAVPAGARRSFTLNGYDASGELIYTGTEHADVVVNEQVRVEITMRRVSAPGGSIVMTGLFEFSVGSIEITGSFEP